MNKIIKKRASALVYSIALLAFSLSILIISCKIYLNSLSLKAIKLSDSELEDCISSEQMIIDQVNEYVNNNENREKFEELKSLGDSLKIENIVIQYKSNNCYTIRAVQKDYTVISVNEISKKIVDENKIVLYKNL